MNYFDEMRTKYGFGDGDSVPSNAGACRTVYITAINKLAKIKGSAYRAYAYDRLGCHNWCLIYFAKVDDIRKAKIPVKKLIDSNACKALNYDEQYDSIMEAVLEEVRDMDLDSLVQWINWKGLNKTLSRKIQQK